MTSAVGFPPETVYDIVDITRSYPGVVTLAEVERPYAFSVSDGQTVTMHNIRGMYQLNYQRFIVQNLNTIAKTFELWTIQNQPFSTVGYTDYTDGGQIDIISYPGTPPGLMYNNQ